MKIRSKILALVMSVALVLTLLPAMAFAEDTPQTDPETPGTEEPVGGDEDVVKPVSAELSILEGVVGTDTLLNLYVDTREVHVTYSDDSSKDFIYTQYPADEADGETVYGEGYILKGSEGSEETDFIDVYEAYNEDEPVVFKVGLNWVDIEVVVPYITHDEETGEEVIEWETLTANTPVRCSYSEPVKVEFEPAEGFSPQGYIGYNYINEETFYGEGNSFVVTYEQRGGSEYDPNLIEGVLTEMNGSVWTIASGGENVTVDVGDEAESEYHEWKTGETVRVYYWGDLDGEYWIDRAILPEDDGPMTIVVPYEYVKEETPEGVVEGFYDNANIEYSRFDMSEGVVVDLAKGTNTVEIPYSEYIDTLDDNVDITFSYDIVADKYDAYANWPVFDYTGKAITKSAFAKKLKVYNSDDKLIPASDYTYTWKGGKKLGWYSLDINFKDKSKYVDSISVEYGIGPKTPKVSKLVRGKKSLTVKWKKFTKAQLKQIDGMYIEIARDKNFTQNYKRIKVTKKALKKSNKKVIKKLAKKKKYFVRMYTYKSIKQNGEKFVMYSSDSNTKSAKTK